MSIAPLESSKPKKPDTRKRIPGRFYGFAIVGLATFLFGLAVWWSPGTLYTVRGRVLLDRPKQTDGSSGDSILPAEITSDPSLASAALEVGLLPPDDSDLGQSAATTAPRVEKLRQRIRLTESDGQTAGQTIVDVELTDAKRKQAQNLVDCLSQQFVDKVAAFGERESQAIKAERKQARVDLAQANQSLQEAKASLNHFVDEQLNHLVQAQLDAVEQPAADSGSAEVSADNAELSGEPSPTSSPSSQPTDSFEVASDEGEPSGELSADEHDATDSNESPVAKSEPATRKTRLEMLISIRSSPEYHERYQTFASDRQRYDEALSAAQQADQPIVVPSARIAETARVIRHRGAAAPSTPIIVLAIIAVLVGWRYAALAHRVKFPLTFASVKDVVDSLQLKVFGTISTPDGHNQKKGQQRGLRLVRTGMRLSEATLAAALILLIFMSIVDRPFVGHLAQDPFSAYSYAVRWVAERLVS